MSLASPSLLDALEVVNLLPSRRVLRPDVRPSLIVNWTDTNIKVFGGQAKRRNTILKQEFGVKPDTVSSLSGLKKLLDMFEKRERQTVMPFAR
jgi:hypothetical protein